MQLINYPVKGMSDAEKWAFLKELERQLKLEMKVIEEGVKGQLKENGGYCRTSMGNVQEVTRTTVKPKDGLKFYLDEMDVLDVCKKDDIDMAKVNELIDCGYLDFEKVKEHLEIQESSYLKLKKAK